MKADLVETIKLQDELINQQSTILTLLNENAEQEAIINEMMVGVTE